jgi:tetratricopeptide (TPR) repeat protein
LNEAISLHREALALQPAPHPDRFTSLNNLAVALRSQRDGGIQVGTLHEAISLHREALALRPAPHPDRPSSLNNLGDALQSLSVHEGGIGSLGEAISLYREALTLCPAFHQVRSASLENLANALLFQFERSGAVEVQVDEAISLRCERLTLYPPGHRSQVNAVCQLRWILVKRREVTGDNRDDKEIEDLWAELAALP